VHNEELYNLYSPSGVIKMTRSRNMRWVGQVTRIEKMKNACRILMGEPEGNRPPERPRRKCKRNIKIGFRNYKMLWTGLICLRIRTSGRIL
jgi:hypothetical protein